MAIFSVLIMAGSFLFEITQYLSQGADIRETIQLVVLLMPGVLAKTFAMAMLLASLLAFGRLSGDSEIVALKASGASMARITAPVVGFGIFVGLLALSFNSYIVPKASFEAWLLKERIKNQIDGKRENSTFRALYEDGKLQGYVMAKEFDILHKTLNKAMVVMVDSEAQPKWTIAMDKFVYNSEEDWKIQGAATLRSSDGQTTLLIKDGAWPSSIPKPRFTPEDLYLQEVRDLDALSLSQLETQIVRNRANPQASRSDTSNLEFGYWNKFALPLAAIVFGLLGAPLGIRSHRTSAASGFWMSVLIIFCYMLLTNVMAIMARNGVMPTWTASFIPILIGLTAAAALIHHRNT